MAKHNKEIMEDLMLNKLILHDQLLKKKNQKLIKFMKIINFQNKL